MSNKKEEEVSVKDGRETDFTVYERGKRKTARVVRALSPEAAMRQFVADERGQIEEPITCVALYDGMRAESTVMPDEVRGLLLRARREKLDLTQAQLAGELGVSNNTLSRWELGSSRPESPEMLDKALSWLELSQFLRDHPFFEGVAGKIAQIEAVTEQMRQRQSEELPELIAKLERDPALAAEVVELKALLAKQGHSRAVTSNQGE
jgi:transcriptional regulator with XRE-family HTH domain